MDALTATTAIAGAATQLLGAMNEMDTEQMPVIRKHALKKVQRDCNLAIAKMHSLTTLTSAKDKIISDAFNRILYAKQQNMLLLTNTINSITKTLNSVTDETARKMLFDDFYNRQLPELQDKLNKAVIDLDDLINRLNALII